MIRSLVLAGQLLVLILSVGLLARPAGGGTEHLPSQIPPSDPTDSSEAAMRTTQSRGPSKRRLALTVGSMASILALLSLTTGLSLAVLSGTESSGSNTFTAGTVTLGTPGAPSSYSQTGCTVTAPQPGGTTGVGMLRTALNAGTTYTSVLVDSISSPAPQHGDALLVGEGTNVQAMTVNTAPSASNGPSSISVNPFTPSSTIPAGVVIDTTMPNAPCAFQISPASGTAYVAVDIAIVSGTTGGTPPAL